eukprot:gene620-908_t
MADQQTAVVQLLAQVGGTNRLLEVPSPIGKDPDMLQLCCSRDPQVLETRMARLKLSGCSEQLVADRLDSMMVSSISCSLDSPDALMACSQAAVVRIYKSVTDTSGATRMQYQDATIGLQYIAARAVTQQLTGLSQCSLSQRRFIMANLYMLHIRNKEFDQAQLLDIMEFLYDKFAHKRLHSITDNAFEEDCRRMATGGHLPPDNVYPPSLYLGKQAIGAED